MRMRDALIAALCFALIALLLIADRYFTVEPEPPAEPEYEMYFTEDDVVAVAKMLWGEARGCALDNQQKAV